MAQNHPAEALEFMDEAVKSAQQSYGEKDSHLEPYLRERAAILLANDRPGDAVTDVARANELSDSKSPATAPR